MWYIAFCNFKPPEIDTASSSKYVYLRRNFQFVTIDENGFSQDYWQYEERKLTHDEYRILQLEDENTNLQLALTELYEKFLEG